MKKPAVPRALLDPVVEYFRPQRVILFGSRARGEATRDSDIDLLVVVDDDTPLEKLTTRAGYEAHRSNRAADVFLAQRSDVDGWLIKPLDAFRLRRASTTLLDGYSYFEGVDADTDLATATPVVTS